MTFKSFFIVCLSTLFFVGCGSNQHWTKSHPLYNQAPEGEIAIAGINKAFILTRSSWFAKKLEISKDSVQIQITNSCKKQFIDFFKNNFSHISFIPEKTINTFAEESQKLDNRIFIKGHFPEQGVIVKDSLGNVPKNILILHEVIIGTDLKRENFFDYALIHNESSEIKTSNNITAIASYTLWDNEKQRPLFSAVEQIDKPISKLSLADLENLVKSIVETIQMNIKKGVVK